MKQSASPQIINEREIELTFGANKISPRQAPDDFELLDAGKGVSEKTQQTGERICGREKRRVSWKGERKGRARRVERLTEMREELPQIVKLG